MGIRFQSCEIQTISDTLLKKLNISNVQWSFMFEFGFRFEFWFGLGFGYVIGFLFGFWFEFWFDSGVEFKA